MTALMYPYLDGSRTAVPRRRNRWVIRVIAALIVEVARQAFGDAGR